MIGKAIILKSLSSISTAKSVEESEDVGRASLIQLLIWSKKGVRASWYRQTRQLSMKLELEWESWESAVDIV